MAYLPELHICCMCHRDLGPENGDGICCECDMKCRICLHALEEDASDNICLSCAKKEYDITSWQMQIGEISEIQMKDFFDLVERNVGTYEVETPQGWIEIGDMKREQKECFLLRTADGLSLGAGDDHLVETQNGWEKVEDLDVQNTVIHTLSGDDPLVAKEYIGVQDTFDFEVLSDEHAYYANGIVSHNCGKTLSCRWLRELCEQNNLAYRVITMEDYREASHRGRVRGLFKLRGKRSGIIFFDDMDVMVKDRKKSSGHELSTFLSELDGLDPADGVVYVFTTNYIDELDEAFVRPGRIDLWLPFQLPSSKLRKKFIDQRFDKEIKDQVDCKSVLERTKNYSFAELEEIRKLFCMELIDEKPINVESIFKTFDKHRKDFEERAIMGFSTLDDDSDDEEEYGDESEFPEIFIPRRYRG